MAKDETRGWRENKVWLTKVRMETKERSGRQMRGGEGGEKSEKVKLKESIEVEI